MAAPSPDVRNMARIAAGRKLETSVIYSDFNRIQALLEIAPRS
jgi:hypothetical protein